MYTYVRYMNAMKPMRATQTRSGKRIFQICLDADMGPEITIDELAKFSAAQTARTVVPMQMSSVRPSHPCKCHR